MRPHVPQVKCFTPDKEAGTNVCSYQQWIGSKAENADIFGTHQKFVLGTTEKEVMGE